MADLVCLHLDAFTRARDHSPAPRSITATGIGDTLEVDDTAANRVQLLNELSSLEERGFLIAEERPVHGLEDPRTVYFLTAEGQDRAEELRARVEAESVVITNGTEQTVPLNEIEQHLDTDTPLITALARLTEEGTVPLEGEGGPSFVDRQAPLQRLVGGVETSIEMDCQTITVAGTSGMGKTAVVKEAMDRVTEDNPDLVEAHGTCPAGTSNPYDPFRQAFESIPDDAALLERLMEAKTSFTPEDPEELEAQRTAFFNDIADSLRDAAAEQPIVLFLDNLQWADGATLNLFEHLATTVTDWLSQIVFIGTYRPDALASGEHELRDTLNRIQEGTSFIEIELDPLTREDTATLLSGIVGGGQLPDGFVDLVHDQTGGNPLFVRETATHLLESGLVDADRDVFPTSPEQVSLPQEVTEQIDQRIMALDDNSRQLLRLGALIGERIPARVLAAASDIPDARRREYEDVLVTSNIWEQTPGAADRPEATSHEEVMADGGRDFRFISGGLREAVVDRLPDTLAPRYHEQIAAAYEDVFEGSVDEYASQIAYHYQEAEAYESAVEYYRRAGSNAQTSYAHEEAVRSYERAIELGRANDVVPTHELAGIAIDLAEVHLLTGEYEAAERLVDDWLELAPPQSREQCRLLGVKALAQTKSGRYQQARETGQRQRERAQERDAGDLEAEAAYQLGTAAWRQAEYQTAQEQLEAALAGFEAVNDDMGIAKARKNLGNVAALRRDDEMAREHYEAARERYDEIDDRHGIASILNNLSILSARAGDHERSIEELEEALEAYEAVGDRHGAATAHLNLGTRSSEMGDLDRAREHLEAAIEGYTAVDDRHGIAKANFQLGKFEELRGDFESAQNRFDRALEGFQTIDNQSEEADVYLGFGNLARKRGQYEQARNHYEHARELNAEIEEPRAVGRCDLQIGLVDRLQGDTAAARDRFEAALERFEEIESGVGITWAHFQLGQLDRVEGHYDGAEDHFEQARDGIESEAGERGTGQLRLATAQLALAREEIDRAADLGNEGLEIFEGIDEVLWAARTRRLLGEVAVTDGRPKDASRQWQDALETFESIGATADALRVLETLVEHYQDQGEEAQADEFTRRADTLLERASESVTGEHRQWIRSGRSEAD
ncbi:MAG: tetratricopeptide repeat protein [Halobacteriales archaeon]